MDSVLQVRGLSKRYPGFALRGVSFSVPSGFIMGLIGPNGAGKTTTLKSILGLVHPDAGEIRIFGSEVTGEGKEARARIGFVHDEPRFFRHLSLAANAGLVGRYYAQWDKAAFRRIAGEFGLPLSKRFGTLSRGNRMKFALAVALSHGAELLVMDEPTGGLDPVFRREFLETLSGLIQDERVSVLFSTHITSDLERIGDFITLLQDGRVVFSVAKDDLLEKWALVKGGPELLDRLPRELFRGIRRGPHSFEALADDGEGIRRRFGGAVIIEKPSLDDIVFFTTGGDADVDLAV